MTASGITSAPRRGWKRPAPASPRTASSGRTRINHGEHGGRRNHRPQSGEAGTHSSACSCDRPRGSRLSAGLRLSGWNLRDAPCLRGKSEPSRFGYIGSIFGAAAPLYDRARPAVSRDACARAARPRRRRPAQAAAHDRAAADAARGAFAARGVPAADGRGQRSRGAAACCRGCARSAISTMTRSRSASGIRRAPRIRASPSRPRSPSCGAACC